MEGKGGIGVLSVKPDQEKRAIFLAAVCGQTYAQFNNPDGLFVVPANYSVTDVIEAKSITGVWERFGFILDAPKEIIIAFRGTSSAGNWISDIIASQKNFKYVKEPCLTHRGFTSIYASARSRVISALSGMSPDKTLYIRSQPGRGACDVVRNRRGGQHLLRLPDPVYLRVSSGRRSGVRKSIPEVRSQQLAGLQPV